MFLTLLAVEIPNLGFDVVAIHDAGEAVLYSLIEAALAGVTVWGAIRWGVSWGLRAMLDGSTKPFYENDEAAPVGGDYDAYKAHGERFADKRRKDWGV